MKRSKLILIATTVVLTGLCGFGTYLFQEFAHTNRVMDIQSNLEEDLPHRFSRPEQVTYLENHHAELEHSWFANLPRTQKVRMQYALVWAIRVPEMSAAQREFIALRAKEIIPPDAPQTVKFQSKLNEVMKIYRTHPKEWSEEWAEQQLARMYD